MTHENCIQAIVHFGFTERQARFVVLVLRHGGVCVPRQYASFAGIANGGRRCNAFFDRLVRRNYAHEIGCVHNRARLYHLHHKPLYHAIGEPSSRYRRRLPPRVAVERLMMLDAVLPIANLKWFTTASEKAAFVANLTTATSADGSPQQRGDISSGNGPRVASIVPIGCESDGRVVLVLPRDGGLAGEVSALPARPCAAAGAGSNVDVAGRVPTTARRRLRCLSGRHP